MSPVPVDQGQRTIPLRLKQAIGAMTISNLGDIVIVRETGGFTAGSIRSQRGDIMIAMKDKDNGDVLGSQPRPPNLFG